MPLSKPEGKIIKQGFHSELDSLRDVQENGRQWLKDFQSREIKRAGINSLKVGFNKVFGYYIEITKANLKAVPENFIRKQTLVNAERFITPELKEYEEKILTAQEKILKIENQLLADIREEILDHSVELHNFAQSIATLDAIYSLCVLAQAPKYIAPDIAEDTVLDIKEGRHPVVEQTSTEAFIPNDTFLDCEDNHLIILTGPNMAGKSTYIRQIALLVILAQMGSYIPCQSAHIGVVDKVFTRIGAHDDIAKGQSTFMVEMTEMADILNNILKTRYFSEVVNLPKKNGRPMLICRILKTNKRECLLDFLLMFRTCKRRYMERTDWPILTEEIWPSGLLKDHTSKKKIQF